MPCSPSPHPEPRCGPLYHHQRRPCAAACWRARALTRRRRGALSPQQPAAGRRQERRPARRLEPLDRLPLLLGPPPAWPRAPALGPRPARPKFCRERVRPAAEAAGSSDHSAAPPPRPSTPRRAPAAHAAAAHVAHFFQRVPSPSLSIELHLSVSRGCTTASPARVLLALCQGQRQRPPGAQSSTLAHSPAALNPVLPKPPPPARPHARPPPLSAEACRAAPGAGHPICDRPRSPIGPARGPAAARQTQPPRPHIAATRDARRRPHAAPRARARRPIEPAPLVPPQVFCLPVAPHPCPGRAPGAADVPCPPRPSVTPASPPRLLFFRPARRPAPAPLLPAPAARRLRRPGADRE
jgi:hypothetical protein